MELLTDQPFWYLLLCAGIGASYAFLLYRKDTLLNEVKTWVKGIMAFFRFITIGFLCFLLLSPFLKIINRHIEKPIIVFAQDNSESIGTTKDSLYYKNEYPKQFSKIIESLKSKYDVKTYSFGDHVNNNAKFSYTEKQTNFSDLFNELNSRYTNRNIGAIILASDGLYNQGSNPLYESDKLQVPVFTIALGDTTVHKDVILKKVNCNKIAYLGNSFPMEILVEARQCNGAKTNISVQKDSSVVFKKSIDINKADFRILIPATFDASHKGLQHYKVTTSFVQGEVNLQNNVKDIYIEVLERKQKVLILANGAHPDVSAIKQSIESNQSYEVSTFLADKFEGSLSSYNLIILHQLPSVSNPISSILNKIKAEAIPVFYILGEQTSLPAFNSLNTGLTISGPQNKTTEVLPYLAPDFSSFTLSEELQKNLVVYPPLKCPFGSYKLNANASALLKQQLGTVKSENPLLLFTDNGESKTGILAGEGIWAWRILNYSEKSNHEAINELISKTVQYLAIKENKTHFKITAKNNFSENEPILFDALLLNEIYEPVNTQEVKMIIFNKDKKQFPFSFIKSENRYGLNAGIFPPGVYTYNASTNLGGKAYVLSGSFSVSPIQAEATETVADHHLLFSMAQKTNGKMLFPNQMANLISYLNEREDIKPVSFSEEKLNEIINLKWVLFILLAFLSVEWFLRKRNGGY